MIIVVAINGGVTIRIIDPIEVSDEVGKFIIIRFLRGLLGYGYIIEFDSNFGEILSKAANEGKWSAIVTSNPMDWEVLGYGVREVIREGWQGREVIK